MTVLEAERDARRLLEASWWLDDDASTPLPVDPMEIARDLGISVQYRMLPPDQSGNIVIPRRGPVVITLNSFDHENRQRFTCAHEIGHYNRRSRQGRHEEFIDYRDTLAGLGRDSEEIYANQFAAALLMPAQLVKRYYRIEDVAKLARRFETSEQAMEVRLRNLGLV